LAVKQLAASFESFHSVERIAALAKGIKSLENVLKAQIGREFEAAFTAGGMIQPSVRNQLIDAGPVIDALGQDAR
jgi:uncharacterized protein YunC (DUF1805 family)